MPLMRPVARCEAEKPLFRISLRAPFSTNAHTICHSSAVFELLRVTLKRSIEYRYTCNRRSTRPCCSLAFPAVTRFSAPAVENSSVVNCAFSSPPTSEIVSSGHPRTDTHLTISPCITDGAPQPPSRKCRQLSPVAQSMTAKAYCCCALSSVSTSMKTCSLKSRFVSGMPSLGTNSRFLCCSHP